LCSFSFPRNFYHNDEPIACFVPPVLTTNVEPPVQSPLYVSVIPPAVTAFRVVVSPSSGLIDVFPEIGQTGRLEIGNVKRLLPVLTEIVLRKAKLEEPLGYLESKDGHSYVITKEIRGKPLFEWLELATRAEKQKVAFDMGKVLADFHNKGIVHSHPHNANWIVTDKGVRLIDPKGIVFREELPHKFKDTGLEVNWDFLRKMDVERVLLETLLSNLRKRFMKSYSSFLNKSS